MTPTHFSNDDIILESQANDIEFEFENESSLFSHVLEHVIALHNRERWDDLDIIPRNELHKILKNESIQQILNICISPVSRFIPNFRERKHRKFSEDKRKRREEERKRREEERKQREEERKQREEERKQREEERKQREEERKQREEERKQREEERKQREEERKQRKSSDEECKQSISSDEECKQSISSDEECKQSISSDEERKQSKSSDENVDKQDAFEEFEEVKTIELFFSEKSRPREFNTLKCIPQFVDLAMRYQKALSDLLRECSYNVYPHYHILKYKKKDDGEKFMQVIKMLDAQTGILVVANAPYMYNSESNVIFKYSNCFVLVSGYRFWRSKTQEERLKKFNRSQKELYALELNHDRDFQKILDIQKHFPEESESN